MDIGPPELILVIVVILVLFGGSHLPKLARNLGKAQAEFKQAMSGKDEATDVAADAVAETPSTSAAVGETDAEPAASNVDA